MHPERASSQDPVKVFTLPAINADAPESKSTNGFVGGGNCTIKSATLNEYLFASSNDPFDNDRRRVFSLRNKGKTYTNKWEIRDRGENKVTIMSSYFKELLYAADFEPKTALLRRVFTWRKDIGQRFDEDLWELQPVNAPINSVNPTDTNDTSDKQSSQIYRLRHVYQDEYLVMGDFPWERHQDHGEIKVTGNSGVFDRNRREVFTWREKGEFAKTLSEFEISCEASRKHNY